VAVTIKKPEAQQKQTAAEAPAKAQKAKRRRGKRITNVSYPAETYEKLFEYVASGEDLTTACGHPHMPSPWTVRRRLAKDDVLNDQYLQAQKIRLHGLADQLVSLPDEALKGYEKVSAADRLTAAKQKADSIRWLLARGLDEYALAGEDGGPTITLNVVNLPNIPILGIGKPAPAVPFVPAGQPVLKIVGDVGPSSIDAEPEGTAS